jgi:hypothetical protein
MRYKLEGVSFIVSILIVSTTIAPLLANDATRTTNDGKPTAVDADLPKSADLRSQLKRWNLLPTSQGARNTCSVFTTTSALEFAVSKHYGKGIRLSVEYLNWACNQVIHNETADRGQFFRDLLKGFERHGICSEANMPYRNRFDPQLKPSETALEKAKQIKSLGLSFHWINPWKPKPGVSDKHLLEIKTVLAKGYPVAAGASHSRLLVGYRDDRQQAGGGKFLTKDSGKGAFSSVTYEFVKQNVADIFWVEAPAKVAATKQ